MKLNAANHLKIAINICQNRKWIKSGCEGDLAALLAHDANADIRSLDHGHIVGTVPNAQHLAAQAPLLALQPPLDALGPTLGLLHLHHTRTDTTTRHWFIHSLSVCRPLGSGGYSVLGTSLHALWEENMPCDSC